MAGERANRAGYVVGLLAAGTIAVISVLCSSPIRQSFRQTAHARAHRSVRVEFAHIAQFYDRRRGEAAEKSARSVE